MFTLAVTDLRWHERLSVTGYEGVLNFWTPTPWRPRLEEGSRWFFMLKAPVRKFGGFGYILGYEEHSPEEAWRRFGDGNGVADAAELQRRVNEYTAKRSITGTAGASQIGCILLRDAVFLGPEDQIAPELLGVGFPRQIVKYKHYSGSLELPIEASQPAENVPFSLVASDAGKVRAPMWTALRPDQALFRSRVLSAYSHRCAFSGTDCSAALDAAHIQPFMNSCSNHVQNGLALRKDLHALFDAGLLGLGLDRRIIVSAKLASSAYAKLAGKACRVPSQANERPSDVALRWHLGHHRLHPMCDEA